MTMNRSGIPRPVVVSDAKTLPVIQARQRNSQFTGYVNAYVVGSLIEDMITGTRERALWYLSMVLPKGHGITGQAIANSLFTPNRKDIWLEGVGQVMLGDRRQDLQQLGYTIHWNYRQEAIGSEAIHVIVESRMLTQFDPLLKEAAPRKERASASRSGKPKEKVKLKETAVLSTDTSANSIKDDSSESLNVECHPMFLLLIPGPYANNQEYIEQLYLAYLEKRLPFALRPEWAHTLWHHAHTKKEIEELTTWSYTYTPRVAEEAFAIKIEHTVQQEEEQVTQEQEEAPFQQVLGAAYLCQPDITGVHTALQTLLRKEEEKEEEVAA